MSTHAPAWFTSAVHHAPSPHRLLLGSTRIQLWHWGHATLPPLILLHGGLANSGWYRHIAPMLCRHYHVLALDFSGHGDSDWRDFYILEDFIDEIAAVVAWKNTPCTLIGHSMGAKLAYWYACLHPHLVKQLILLDPPMLKHNTHAPARPVYARKPERYYQDRDTLIHRFRILPPQPILHPWLGNFVAENSITKTSQGYRWKTDLSILSRLVQNGTLSIPQLNDTLPCRLIYGEHSALCTKAVLHDALTTYPHWQTICLHGAYHALMLDQPQKLIQILQSLVY